MGKLKNFALVVLVFAVFFAVREQVCADMPVNEIEEISHAIDEAAQDPLYARYNNSFALMSSGSKLTISTAKKKIVHQTRFKDKYICAYGIDVSKWQGTINWKKVKADGVDFAIIRLGYRGMADGSLNIDSYFVQNIKAAHEAGVEIGIYFFTQAITTSEAKKEAEYCISKLAPYKNYVSYPVMIDLEPCGGRLDKANLSKAKKTSICESFCSTIEAAGYTSGIYCSKSYFSSWLNMSNLENKYYVWLAHYTDNTDYTGKFDMWQFSSSCSVNGITGYVDMDVCYLPADPSIPRNLAQASGDDSTVTLSWGAVAGADGYKLYQYTASGSLEKSYTSAEPEYTVTGLTKGKTYYYKVRSYSVYIDGTKKYSKYTSKLAAYTIPNGVAGLTASARTDSTVTIKWDKVSNATGYRVRMYNSKTGAYETVKNVYTNSYTVANLDPASSYTIKVQAFALMSSGTKLYGSYSGEKDIYTQPKKVTGLKIRQLQMKNAAISWNKESGVSGYRVYLYNEKKKLISKADTRDNSFLFKGLAKGTKYFVKVRAFYPKNNGAIVYGALTTATEVKTLPAKVTKISVKNVTADRLTLKWKKKAGADGYKVYLYDSSTKTYKKIKTTTSTTYTMKNLKPGKAYKIKVVAYVVNGTKKYAGNESAVYTAITKPSAIKNLGIASTTKSSVSISWKKAAGAAGYQVKVYNSKKKLVGTYTTAKLSCKCTKLSGRYTIKVRAYAKLGKVKAYGSYTSISASTR